jgi:transcriptional regulator with XRE-family HTH domain
MTTRPTPKSNQSLSLLEKLTGKKLTIGLLLWAIRESDEISQVDFAKRLNISRQYLCDLERGRRIISTKTAARFANVLGYSPAQLIRLAIQDELNKNGLHFDVDIHEQRAA